MINRSLRLLVCWMLCSTPAAIAHANLAPIRLFEVPGGSSAAVAINRSGQVAGFYFLADGSQHAFMWTATNGMTDLGTLGGDTYAIALNDNGQVVGTSTLPDGSRHAYMWTAANGMVDLGTLGGPRSYARAINASGQVVGESEVVVANRIETHAFLWSDATGMIDAGTFDGTASLFGNSSFVSGINDAGQVVGSSAAPPFGYSHAFLWTATDGMIDLGTLLGGTSSGAAGINAVGQVAGTAGGGGTTGDEHAFIWTTAAGITDLGTFGSHRYVATAINDRGETAGYTIQRYTAGRLTEPAHIFAWTPLTGMIDLGSMNGTRVTNATINYAGQIAASGYVDGSPEDDYFLWTPNTGMLVLDRATNQNRGVCGESVRRGVCLAMNDAGTVVGVDGDHAVLWPPGTMQDLLWQNDGTRQVASWHMGGTQGIARLDWDYVSKSGVPGWKIVGTADFDGDGHADIVWQHDATRQVVVWYMGGSPNTTMTSWDYASSIPIPGWTVVAIADLNGDGHPDLVWQNDVTRQLTVFYMGGAHGTTRLGWSWLSQTGVLDWSVVAVRDFDGDGHPDLVWQHDTTRQVIAWYMGGAQGTTVLGMNWLAQSGVPGWKVVGSRDVDGDGHADLVWQNDTTRAATVWYMGGPQGATLRGWNWLSVSVPGWTLIGR